jgi:hypothetical protein
MSRARDFADLAGSADAGGITGRNRLINGSFAVAQRGTSSTSGGYVSLDRWFVNQSGGSTTFSQETNSNPSETGGLQKYARLNVSTSSDFTTITQKIEDVTSVPAGTVTISFYAKGTAPTGGLYVYGTQDFGTSGSSDVDLTAVQVTASLTSSWVRYTAQLTIPSVDGKTINAGSFLVIAIGQYSNTGTTAYDLNITGVQLEVGEQATPFEHRSFADELARCQRYYQVSGSSVNSSYNVFPGQRWSSNNIFFSVPIATSMRANPTIGSDVSGNFGFVGGNNQSKAFSLSEMNFVSLDSSSITARVTVDFTPNSAYAYTGYFNTAGELQLDAEL